MTERTGIITFQGNELTLTGNPVKVGESAPRFTGVKKDLTPFDSDDLQGKTRVIVSVPSLDTPVCDVEAQRFNQEAAQLGDVAVITVSMDLPFAQARWCGAAGADKLTLVSDHRDAAFGQAYGQLIKELRLLARTVFVIDRKDKITYIQQVAELTKEPDYAEAIAAIKTAAQ